MIANDVAEQLKDSKVFSEVVAVAPGFLNLKVSEAFLLTYLQGMEANEKFGLEKPEHPKKIIIDYGGPNVAKPLHVGHLRSAVIGESVKRISRYVGHEVIGDVHLGDWGLQMGLVITGLQERQPELVYFDENYAGEYPEEAPFTISELEEIYPAASAKSKEDPEYKAKAMEATFKLQSGVRGYRALWKHIINVSVNDLKKNYSKLNVEFDLWKGESDVHDIIPEMVAYMKDNGYAHLSEGALVVDVKEDTDTKEIPPCMILKSDGGLSVQYHRPGYYYGAYEAVSSRRADLRGGQASGIVLRAGIPLCPQDEIGRTRDRAEVLGLRYHERQGWQTLQDQTGRCYASREPDQGYPG